MTFLETERLLFRQHQLEDEADFIRMHMDREVRRYAGGQGWPKEKAEFRFRNEYLGRPTETFGLWATILKEESKYIGCCGLRASENEREAYIGYYLARPYWRRGLATEASQAFLDLAFTRLRFNRVLADVEQGNAPSECILKKFGFDYLTREEIPISGRVIITYELGKARFMKAVKPLSDQPQISS
jgi:[ribosomal protein S5]-alanine N-acetyltransferase